MRHTVFAFVLVIDALGCIVGAAASVFLSKCCVSARSIIQTGLLVAFLSTLAAAGLQWTTLPVTISFLPLVFMALLGFNLAGPSLLSEALQPVPVYLVPPPE